MQSYAARETLPPRNALSDFHFPAVTQSAARGLAELLNFRLARFPVDPSAGQPGDHHLDQSDQRRHGGKTEWEQMRDHRK